jgi:division protein CdvB (Snf7/Vps24/ESCRT-III family)
MKKSVRLIILEGIESKEGSKEEVSKKYSETNYINVRELKNSICRLKIQQNKLEQTYLGLKELDHNLFEKCKSAIKENNKEKANKYAVKISEIRKTIKFLYDVQMGIERFVIRLESKLEIGDVDKARDPKLALLCLQSMLKELSKINLAVCNELKNICSGMEDKLVP